MGHDPQSGWASTGVWQRFADFVEAWVGGYEEWRVDPEEIRDLGGGITLAVALQSGRLALAVTVKFSGVTHR